jgi:KDO2-lipid IV(A) lauroyltransferase
LAVLYLLLPLVYVIVNHVVRYRRKVVDDNLLRSFPELTARERRRVRNRYYWHLSQIAVEMIKMLLIPRCALRYRYRCVNPELVNRFYEEGRSVILMSSHYNNWEWMIVALDEMFLHHGIGVGKANSDKVFEKWVNRARTRRGTEVCFADTAREVFAHYEENHIPAAYMMLADQSPSNPKKCYVTQFLNQATGVIYGPEYFARKYDIPVLYYQVIKERIGKYRVEIQVITEYPNDEEPYAITQKYTELLEQTIRRKPEYWIWSHRRWKLKF